MIMENNQKIYIPSFKYEKKTKALNRFLFPFVSFISMFTVGVFIGGFIYAFNVSFLKLPVNHMSWYFLVPVGAFLLSVWPLVRFLLTLMSAYRIEDGKITRGYIFKTALGISSSVAVSRINTRGISLIIALIRLNMDPGFAEDYFDTDVYRKKEFMDPVLVKETKHLLIYDCGGEKLRIPKVFEGMSETSEHEGTSFIARIAIVSAIVFAIALGIAIGDLAIMRYKTVTEYAPSISAAESKMDVALEDYGYTLSFNSAKVSKFKKKVGDRTSEVTYTFDKRGNIERVKVQLYFSMESSDIDGELRTVISTLDAGFSENDVEELIAAVNASLNGEYCPTKIASDRYSLRVGTSGEYVDVH